MAPLDPRLVAEAGAVGAPLVFCTQTGDRAWGIPAPADEADLRAAHVLPVEAVVSLRAPNETIAHTAHRDGLDIEFLSQDVKRLCLALLKKNGQALEPIHSPLVVATSPWHDELKELSFACAGRHWAAHYRSHARMLWSTGGTLRNVVRAARVLLTGAHLLATGRLVTDLPRLADESLRDLLAAGSDTLDGPVDQAAWTPRHDRWRTAFEDAVKSSLLPASTPDAARSALDDWLVRIRLRQQTDGDV